MEHAIKAELLNVPSLSRLLEESKVFDPLSVSKAREAFRSEMADFCKEEFLDLYDRLCKDGDASMEASDVARRSLKNTCLAWLGSCPDGDLWKKAWAQMKGACNMTDRMSAFRLLMKGPDSFKHDAIALFEELFQSDPLVMNKFFAVQSSRQGEGVLEDVLRLEQHACYDAKNPNKVRALLGGFGRNLVSFHAEDGSGYDYLSQRILSMDEYNPSMASALARFYAKYPVLKLDMAVKMEAAMKKILLKPGLSSDTYEIVSKTLSSRG
jgi:aminopeptidase N